VAEHGIAVTDESETKARKENALQSSHAAHSAWLHAFLCRTLRLQPTDADDIVQDTWLRAIRISFADIEHPRAYLSRIALNLFRDRKRRDAVRTTYRRLTLVSDRTHSNPCAMTEQEAQQDLERLILDLPDILRDVFLLSRFGRMTNRDIAAYLGISVKTVEWRISKAMHLCASKLQD
jgi:RNA polymerase sigma-70 factor (ECF subfamily)